jgi:hypothetical protein
MSRKNFQKVNLDDIIEKIKSLKKISTDKELAELFEISAPDFSKRKRIGSLIPLIVLWAISNKIDLNWLFGYQGDIFNDDQISNKIIDIDHSEIIKKFANKDRAKNANLDLLRIESLDRDKFLEVIGYIKGVANSLEDTSGNSKPVAGTKKKANL